MADFLPFHGEAVALRAFEPDDIPALSAYLNHPEMMGCRYLPWGLPDDAPLSRRQVESIYEQWVGREHGLALAVVRKDSGVLVGHASAEWDWDVHCPFVAVAIAPDHQRHGYGADTARLLVHYVFDCTPAHVVQTGFASWNDAARALCRHIGLTETGAMRRVEIRQGRYFDWITADLLRREWQATRKRGGSHAVGR